MRKNVYIVSENLETVTKMLLCIGYLRGYPYLNIKFTYGGRVGKGKPLDSWRILTDLTAADTTPATIPPPVPLLSSDLALHNYVTWY